MAYWLVKSETSTWSWDQQVAKGVRGEAWTGVRNFTARQNLNNMKKGDKAFFYHSNCDEPGIVGVVEVSAPAYPDDTQFDKKSPYYDPASKKDAPRWLNVDFKFVKKTPLVSLGDLRKHKKLANMRVLQPGNRLSITPVDPAEWEYITEKLMAKR